MSPHLINIDEDVFAELQRLATPLVDDANSVLRRVMGLPSPSGEVHTETAATAAEHSGHAERPVAARVPTHATSGQLDAEPAEAAMPEPFSMTAPRGSRLPQAEYEVPILESLVEMGGSAHSSRVVQLTGRKLKERLTPVDYTRVKSGETRWQNRARFARLMLKNRGEIAKDSPHGIWEITDAGRARVCDQRGQQATTVRQADEPF